MARFYVGQRVRVVCPGVSTNGRETTIRELNVMARHYGATYCGHLVDIPHPTFGYCAYEPHELEPIQDPGRQVVSWEGGVWMPEHLRESLEVV